MDQTQNYLYKRLVSCTKVYTFKRQDIGQMKLYCAATGGLQAALSSTLTEMVQNIRRVTMDNGTEKVDFQV